ncbi:MAG: lactate racemase domain-containing protein, partial [Candidatus Bathyarchaeota archaeon]|nr:lactate racemase domain-containing protein [Candidatus Bathyarchaeota archaeon]
HNPVESPTLKRLADGAHEVVIIIDDMTRPTKSYQYAVPILEILNEAEIPRDNIRFIISPGTHGTYGRLDFVKKLGEEIVDGYQCYNHNPYEMLDYLGETSYGTPVYVNSEVMRCDLKIGIGTTLFHRLMGLSGGGKIISPGVAGMVTIRHNHGPLGGFGPDLTPHETTGYLKNEGNIMRLDAEETARMAGLDFKVDTVLNLERDPLEVHAGDFVATQRRAAAGSMKWHRCESPEAEIVVVNSYMRENEPFLGFWSALNSVTEDGTVVLITMDPEGDINHWLFNHHGKFTGSSLWNGKAREVGKGARLIIHGPRYRSQEMRLGNPETTTWIKEWDDVIEELEKYHDHGSRVAVLPDGTSGIPEKVLDSL